MFIRKIKRYTQTFKERLIYIVLNFQIHFSISPFKRGGGAINIKRHCVHLLSSRSLIGAITPSARAIIEKPTDLSFSPGNRRRRASSACTTAKSRNLHTIALKTGSRVASICGKGARNVDAESYTVVGRVTENYQFANIEFFSSLLVATRSCR